MDLMQELETIARNFSGLKNIQFVEFIIKRNFAISVIDNEFLPNDTKRTLFESYMGVCPC